MILCMLLTQTHRSASTIVSHWFGPLVQNASWGGSGASVGPCPLYLESCGVKGTSPPPMQYERLLLQHNSSYCSLWACTCWCIISTLMIRMKHIYRNLLYYLGLSWRGPPCCCCRSMSPITRGMPVRRNLCRNSTGPFEFWPVLTCAP
jgi:hypothetical protein